MRIFRKVGLSRQLSVVPFDGFERRHWSGGYGVTNCGLVVSKEGLFETFFVNDPDFIPKFCLEIHLHH